MNLKEVEWEYDCGHGSTNDFTNLPLEEQEWLKKQAEVAESLERKLKDENKAVNYE